MLYSFAGKIYSGYLNTGRMKSNISRTKAQEDTFSEFRIKKECETMI
jgi:hypothetical protein